MKNFIETLKKPKVIAVILAILGALATLTATVYDDKAVELLEKLTASDVVEIVVE